ncbi:hypothetical protein QQX10_09170 [Demequina sp. SYSU T00039]|uniref:Integral membrane protein n=1 Tax=Demequina lignilytica TaxID=3051663 RepID=A0AAW7M3X0_9MICO|nr:MULTISPECIES: hypothetical protein [unclassified Demequina]MDN4478213.1 hypothetical protein [Demequina sp. SYSU T00039-1]MDN4488337.1 hypothetical protein [Demequina sp. SYSU T00039]MDN4490116.1 hypothetical protein [Demequina sp. SYSU T00068]
MSWYQDLVVDTGRAPALWLLIGFLATFAATRWVTRRIRTREASGGGGVVSNIHIGGVHVHHQVWGILLVLVTGLLAFRFAPGSPWQEILAALFGAGAALALDEFALWLHLEDVYWSAEGRKSIDAILVAAVVGAAFLVQVSPIGIAPDDAGSVAVYLVAVALHLTWVVVAFLKGKRHLGLIGIVVPLVSLVCGLRLAKPTSFWARRFYGEAKMTRALHRFSDEYQARWDRLRDRIGGAHGHRVPAAMDRLVHDEIVHATVDAPGDVPRAPRGPDAR